MCTGGDWRNILDVQRLSNDLALERVAHQETKGRLARAEATLEKLRKELGPFADIKPGPREVNDALLSGGGWVQKLKTVLIEGPRLCPQREWQIGLPVGEYFCIATGIACPSPAYFPDHCPLEDGDEGPR